MRRTIGRLARLMVLGAAALVMGHVGVALGSSRVPAHLAFLPFPSAVRLPERAAQGADSARVRRLLQAARGTNSVVCELAARAVDGRSGWSSGDGGDFYAGGASDSASLDVAGWVHHDHVDASVVPLLAAALADPDWCVRRLAAPLLGRTRDRSAMRAMLAALAAQDAVTREMAALALGFANDSGSVRPLVARLHDDAPRVRATAAWALGELERHEAVRPLIEALSDADALVRESAARSLGEVEDTAAIPALTERLRSDRAASVRRAAARALGEIAG